MRPIKYAGMYIYTDKLPTGYWAAWASRSRARTVGPKRVNTDTLVNAHTKAKAVSGVKRIIDSKKNRSRPGRNNPKHNWVMPALAVGTLGLAGWYFFIRKPTPPALPAKTA